MAECGFRIERAFPFHRLLSTIHYPPSDICPLPMNPSTAYWMALAGLILLAAPVRAQQTFTIAGAVTANGAGLADVTMVLGGAKSDTTTTNENGEFSFMELAAGTYTVTPTDTNYAFSPESLTITLPGTATPLFDASMVATSTQAGQEIPAAFALAQNYPNPFNPETVIRYHLAEAGPVRLDVLDVLGRTMAVLVDDARNAGTHAATFDARHLPSGLYLYRLQAGSTVLTRRMVLAK